MQPRALPLPPAQKPETAPVDLRQLFRNNGGLIDRPLPACPPWRPQVRLEPNLPGRDLGEVEPLRLAAAIDGIQTSMLFSIIEGRPAFLTYVAAGAVGPTHQLTRVAERLLLLASVQDAEQLETTACGVQVVALDALSPPALAWHHDAAVPDFRQQLEAQIVAAAAADGGHVLVDGAIDRCVAVPEDLIGCVKDPESAYAVDESQLYKLPVGHRSDGSGSSRTRSVNGAGGAPTYGCIRRTGFTP